jgi:cytoskeleton protein RodZ
MRRRRVSLPVGKWLVRGVALAAVLIVLVYAAPLVERLWSDKEPQTVTDALKIPQPSTEVEAQIEYIDIPSQEQTVEEPADVTELSAEPVSEPQTVEQETVQEVAATPPAAQEQAGPAVVTLRFLDDSWVEMEAHGRKLVVGTQRAGSERTVTAEPPIFILLGNAPAVELSYRGASVDLAPYQRGNVARVTLED